MPMVPRAIAGTLVDVARAASLTSSAGLLPRGRTAPAIAGNDAAEGTATADLAAGTVSAATAAATVASQPVSAALAPTCRQVHVVSTAAARLR